MTKVIDISEDSIIKLLRKRDKEGISILYDTYSAAIFAVIKRIVVLNDVAESIMQETFIKIWTDFDKYDSAKARLFTWIISIGRSLAIEKTRARDKNLGLVNSSFYVELNYSFNQDLLGIKEQINKLSPEQKKMVDLLYFRGYTQSEVSEELKLPLAMVKARARLVINTLRKEFDIVKI